MKKTIKWVLIAVLVVVLLIALQSAYKVMWLSSEGNELISGDARMEFVESATNGCVESLSDDPAYMETPREEIASYCSCASDVTADQITNIDMVDISNKGSLSLQIQERVSTLVREMCNMPVENL